MYLINIVYNQIIHGEYNRLCVFIMKGVCTQLHWYDSVITRLYEVLT